MFFYLPVLMRYSDTGNDHEESDSHIEDVNNHAGGNGFNDELYVLSSDSDDYSFDDECTFTSSISLSLLKVY